MRFIDSLHDRWHLVVGEDGPIAHPDAQAHRLLTLEQWHAVRSTWPQGLATGLVLPNTLDAEELASDLSAHRSAIALLVLQFPKWTDGRAYSQARVLRSRLQFKGEIRASGEVLVDMLPLLHRTGFDAVALRADQNVESAKRALRFFASHYQGDTVQPQPHFARSAS